MAPETNAGRAAYVEDADDDETSSSVEGIEGTRQYAVSAGSESGGQQSPNTSRSRRDRPTTSQSKTPSRSPGMAKTAPSHGKGKSENGSQNDTTKGKHDTIPTSARDQIKGGKSSPTSPQPTRPAAPRHAATQPRIVHNDQPNSNGATPGSRQPPQAAGRPQPQSRHTTTDAMPHFNPPIMQHDWHQPQPFPMHPPPVGFNQLPHPFPGPPPMMMPGAAQPPPPEYFDHLQDDHAHDRLRQRFNARPSSSMDYHNRQDGGYPGLPQYETDDTVRLSRRNSRTQRDDRQRMPPPDFLPTRARTTRPDPVTPYRPPPQRSQARQSRPTVGDRRSIHLTDRRSYDDAMRGSTDLFQDVSPQPAYDPHLHSRSRRHSGIYERRNIDIPSGGIRSNRSSFHGGVALGSGGISLENDKYLNALRYQEDVSGGPQIPLTEEYLRRATKGPNSRSTRSSASRDESDYRRSNTTAMTRSSNGTGGGVTIKVAGSAVVRVDGTEIACRRGGEIRVVNRPPSSRGSDRGGGMYQIEDTRSRLDHMALPQRPRAPSQADSYSRGYDPLDIAYHEGGYL